MSYLPHSPTDITKMLEAIGIAQVDDLFSQIPKRARFAGELQLPPPLEEWELKEHLEQLANQTGALSFLGAGLVDHFIPAAVDQLLSRSEFYTAYTPYQPEISQGTLQAIFEFQTNTCRILEMAVANASMYDGATAMVEGTLLARRATRKERIVVSTGVHPEYIETLETYLTAQDGHLNLLTRVDLNPKTGQTDLESLQSALDDDVAAVVIATPNFYGVVEPLHQLVPVIKECGALTVSVTTDLFAFGQLAPPGAFGVDIATAEGQAISVPVSYGGPGLGMLAIREDKKLLRQMPGRLVGKTVDTHGKDGFVLTLSTREQHIRRQKATSNICSNHGLCALSSVINTSLLGKTGFAAISKRCIDLGAYLKNRIDGLPGFHLTYTGPTFNEVTVTCEQMSAAAVIERLTPQQILAGVALDRFFEDRPNELIITVTEKHSVAKIDRLIGALAAL